MSLDDSTPVLVGAGQVVRRPGDEVPSLDGMLRLAADATVADAGPGGPALFDRVSWVGVPEGAWSHPDPGHVVVPGAARSVLARVGVLQQELLDRALVAVTTGGAPAALVVGAEVAHGGTGGAASAVASARQGDTAPDELLETHDFGISPLEFSTGLYEAPVAYALLESAWGRAQGWSAATHRQRLDELQASFAAVAATNPFAWSRDGVATDDRMVAEPYTKLCCSNMRVNMGAGLLLTTVGEARAAGVAEDRWVFPWGGAVANQAVPVIQRPELHSSPNVVAVLAALPALDRVAHVDLYSCFPIAVQVAAAALGRSPLGATVTGGMVHGGGPLNSYALHALATMAAVLRADPGSLGLVTSVSGFLTKYGGSVWSTSPPPAGAPWRGLDVTGAASGDRRPEAEHLDGPASVVASTVLHARDGSRRGWSVVEDGSGVRSVTTAD